MCSFGDESIVYLDEHHIFQEHSDNPFGKIQRPSCNLPQMFLRRRCAWTGYLIHSGLGAKMRVKKTNEGLGR